MTSIGIDIGAKELVVAIYHKGVMQKVKSFPNTAAGHQKIIMFCSKYLKYGKVTIAMESTGIYYFDLAVALAACNKFEIIVANPRATKHFARASMARNKTDKVDAQILALFAEKMDYPSWKKPSDQAIKVRYLTRTIDNCTRAKARAKNHLHAIKACDSSPDVVLKVTTKEIEFYEKMIEQLQQEIIMIIEQDDQLKQWYALLQTIKGFGTTSSIQLIGEIISIPQGLTHKQWVAFAGLDPRQFQSGTSINKTIGISKAGSRRMRCILFLPAVTAANNDLHIKSYYHHLLENRGLAKLQAIIAVMRKLIHAIHGMLHQNASFDSTRFYAGPLKA